MRMPIEKKIWWGLGIAMTFVAFLGAIGLGVVADFVATTGWVEHTHQVIEETQETYISLAEAGALARGYLLTRNEEYRAPYQQAVQHVHNNIESLKSLTSDNPDQREKVGKLKMQMDRDLELLAEMVQTSGEANVRATPLQEFRQRTQQAMSEIRESTQSVVEGEQRLLSLREAKWRRDLRLSIPAGALLGLFNLVLLVTIYIAFKRDLTERRQAAERVRLSEAHLASVLDGSPSAIYVKDSERRYALVNRQFEEAFHLSRDQVLGRDDFDLFPAQTAQKLREDDGKALAAGKPLEFEEVVPRPDGLHTYLSAKVPLLDGANPALGICGVLTDITERKRAEAEVERLSRAISNRAVDRTVQLMQANEALNVERTKRVNAEEGEHEARELLQEVFLNNPVPMWTYDLETLAFQQANDAALALHAVSRQEVSRLRMPDLYASEDLSRLAQDLAPGQGGRPGVRIWRLHTPDGQGREVLILPRRVEWGGRSSALIIALAEVGASPSRDPAKALESAAHRA